MTMADVLKIFLLVVGAQLIVVCYWLLSEALFPSLVEKSRRQYAEHPVKITLVGVFVGIPIALLGVGIMNGLGGHPLGNLIGGGIAVIAILVGLIGSTGLPKQIGLGLPSPNDDSQPWKRVLRGGFLLVMAFLLPFLGWFLVTGLTLVSGFGAAFRVWMAYRAESKEPAEPPVEIAAA